MAPFYIGGEKWNHGQVYTDALAKFLSLRQQQQQASAQASVAAERNDIEREQLKQQMLQNELQRQFQANEAERERGWRTGERKDTQGFTAGEANAQRGWEGGFRQQGLDLQRRGVEMQERGDVREGEIQGLKKQLLGEQVKTAALQSQYLPTQLKQAIARDDLSIEQLKQAIDRGMIDTDTARRLAPLTIESQEQVVMRGREDLSPDAVSERQRGRKAGVRLAEAQATEAEGRPAEADKNRMQQLHMESQKLATKKDAMGNEFFDEAEYGRRMRLGLESIGKKVEGGKEERQIQTPARAILSRPKNSPELAERWRELAMKSVPTGLKTLAGIGRIGDDVFSFGQPGSMRLLDEPRAIAQAKKLGYTDDQIEAMQTEYARNFAPSHFEEWLQNRFDEKRQISDVLKDRAEKLKKRYGQQ
jgi:hypothetical protein